MKKVTILGGNGKIAQELIPKLKENGNFEIKLFVRDPKKLKIKTQEIVTGDATNKEDVLRAIKNSDIVYSNLGPLGTEKVIDPIIDALHEEGIKRIIWISTIGVYEEVPFSEQAEKRLKASGFISQNQYVVKKLEESDLEYTIIRPNWITYDNEVNYETYDKEEKIAGNHVTQKSVVDFLEKILLDDSNKYIRKSIAISDADSPNLER